MHRAPLSRTKAELRSARAALRRMREAHSLDDAEDGWRDFLTAIEKSWLKAERECQSVRKQFEPWQKTFKEERGADPLLQYLRHARNADSHTIQDTLQRQPGGFGLGPSKPGVWHIEKLVINAGQIVEYSGNQPMKVTFVPARLALMPVTDRGVTYAPPATHRGRMLLKVDPISVAALGLAYYDAFVAEAECRFFSSSAPGV